MESKATEISEDWAARLTEAWEAKREFVELGSVLFCPKARAARETIIAIEMCIFSDSGNLTL
jgi:hypothetical protein